MRNIRHSLRVILRNPGVSALAIASLVLAITLNAVIFSLADWLWLRPSPYESPREVVRIFASSERSSLGSFSWPDYVDIRDGMQNLTGLAAVQHRGASLWGEEYSVNLLADVVSRNFFDVLGTNALMGNVFRADDSQDLLNQPLVVISHSLWRRNYGSDPDIVGKTVQLTGRDRIVMGVAPESFYGMNRMIPVDVWFPVETWGNPSERVSREFRDFYLVGRLKEGRAVAQAQAEAESFVRQLELKDFSTQTDQSALVLNESGYQNRQSSTIGLLLFAIVGAVLLIACANVSGLMLARSITRLREMAIRLAVGGNRSHLIRQLMTEGLLMSLIAMVISLVLTHWVLGILPSLMPSAPFYIELGFTLDGRAIGFAFLLALFTAVITGLVPALHASRPNVVPLLKGDATVTDAGTSRLNSLNVLVIGQLALSFILISSTGLLLRSFNQVYATDLGFSRNNILVATIYPPGDRNAAGIFSNNLLEQVRRLPGVERATISRHVPFFPSGGGATRTVYVPDSGERWFEESRAIKFNIVEKDYFNTIDMPILVGRSFAETDDENGVPVIVINMTMAERYWPGEDPIGKPVLINKPDEPPALVIGVVPDSKYNNMEEESEPYFYIPFGQLQWSDYLLLVYTGGDLAPIVEPVRETIRSLNSEISIFPMTTLYQVMRDTTYERELVMWFVLSFACIGVILSAIGLFGVVSYAVSRRTHEFGVRMALGADGSDIIRQVIFLGGRLGLFGLAVGIPVAVIMGVLMRSMLFGVRPLDPVSMIIALLVVFGIAMLATVLPGRKAASVHPLEAIRYE